MDVQVLAPADAGQVAEPARAPTVAPPAPAWTLLCVDDEPNIVASLRRLFHGSGYRVLTAHGGEQALALMQAETVDLVISDMRMPGMDGAQLLEQVRARWPNATRLLLTGYADVQSTVAAINRGEVYRYIAKPWNDEELLHTVRGAFELQGLAREKRRLEALTAAQNAELARFNATLEQKVEQRTAELSQAHDKLKKNYLTSIKVFSNLIELRSRALMGHARRVGDLARRTARAMNLPSDAQQDIFVAGLLHDIGHIGLADTLLARPVPRLSEEEQVLYRKHAAMGEQALMALDDMQPVAALIRAHHERHDGRGFPDALAGDAIPVGARILAVVDAYDELLSGHLGSNGLDAEKTRYLIARGRGTIYHPEVVDVFLQMLLEATPAPEVPPVPVTTAELQLGMVLARELVSAEGVMLLAAGQAITPDLIRRIRHYESRDRLKLVLLVKPARRT
ncbi:MAG TPA: HD domain-containing phosphohydrolase [Methylibium sp.]|nr:HD domain-containing phosphohydrolase [Methylibium sp.]